MRYSIIIVTTIALIAAFVLSNCDSPDHRTERAETSVVESDRDRNMQVAQNEVNTEVREYRAENADRIMEYNRKIEEIKQEIANESDSEVRARHEERLERYEETHQELKREMDNYRASGKDNWENFKDSFSNRMDDLGDSLDDFFSTSSTSSTASRNQP